MLPNMKMKNIFADKATLIARKMFRQAERKWVVRDFTGVGELSLGMAQAVLEAMEKKGYVTRVKKGPRSYTVLANKESLIDDWLKEYNFEVNEIYTYYSPEKDIFKKIKGYFENNQYTLTLHTAANLITNFVKTDEIFFYLKTSEWDKEVLNLRQKLGLKELVRGGNVHIIKPFYKTSVFFNTQNIKGFTAVSNLQIYLDLYHFQPRGREHAEYFKKLLEERGEGLE